MVFSLGVVGLSGLFALERASRRLPAFRLGPGPAAAGAGRHLPGLVHACRSGRGRRGLQFDGSLDLVQAQHSEIDAGAGFKPAHHPDGPGHQYGICPDHATGGAESLRDQGHGRRCLFDGGVSGHLAFYAADVGRPGPGYSFPPAFALASFYGALTYLKRRVEILL